jgi:ATP-dependent Lhr-like helicase
VLDPPIVPPASRASRSWTRHDASVEVIRGRLSIVGPTTAAALAASLAIPTPDSEAALIDLEGQGVVLRGQFSGVEALEWCDRRLLARIHRYTLNRLRAEIEPVTVADFMRFLFSWQHVAAGDRLTGLEGLGTIVSVFDGFELPAKAWERSVLPARLDRYDKSMLDMVSLTGQAGWGRLSVPPEPNRDRVVVHSLRVALCLREHSDAWQTLRFGDSSQHDGLESHLDTVARQVLATLRARGASFFRDLASACALSPPALHDAIATLASTGLVTSDGFAGLRSLLRTSRRPTSPAHDRRHDAAGRWSAISVDLTPKAREAAVEIQARALLTRYGLIFRRLLTRETNAATWRELIGVYRGWEARGEIRGGRFVAGMSGEQFALPEAVERLREVRRQARDGRLVTISAADPLNLTGILTSDDRVRTVTSNRIVYRDGVALAAMEGDYLRPLAPIASTLTGEVANALAGRRVPAVASGFVGR